MDKLVKSVDETAREVDGKVSGSIPTWLTGSLVRVGPGKWDLKDGFVLNHWLDGCALMAKFTISNGQVRYSSKFLQSDAYKKMTSHGKPVYTEFGTRAYSDPSKNMFSRFVNTLVPCDLTDNDISNIYTIGEEVFVSTESCNVWQIDPSNLSSKNKLNLDKLVGVSISCSHPHVSDADGTTYNLGASFLSGMKYHIVKIPAIAEKAGLIENDGKSQAYKKATVFTTINSSYKTCFSYIHSFSITQHYIIFVEQPLLVNGFKLATCTPKGKPMTDCLEWHGQEPARFHVIDKQSGQQVKVKYHSEGFYHWHTINAYEEDGHVVVDIVTYENADVLEKYNLQRMRNNEWDSTCPPVPKRFVLPLGKGADFEVGTNLVKLQGTDARAEKNGQGIVWLSPEVLGQGGFELPTINYKGYNGRKYRYIYGSGVFERGNYANAVGKLDIHTKSDTLWTGWSTLFPGEPIFVPRPGGDGEDDGVLLSVALEADATKPNLLLILDAKSMTELARAEVSKDEAEIPTTIHGTFVPTCH
ncbi:Beta,beta-carotene 9',10'-oxygenase [Halotydeus destructor]|nr:Beta,beta-carotene 9',10'-oxygenase [Halotydeus destructor]